MEKTKPVQKLVRVNDEDIEDLCEALDRIRNRHGIEDKIERFEHFLHAMTMLISGLIRTTAEPSGWPDIVETLDLNLKECLDTYLREKDRKANASCKEANDEK
jgi:hypothetical protein